jgi:hypothetical protein
VENQLDARILSADGHQSGTLRVELWPVAQDGSLGIPDEEVVDASEDLLGTRMSLMLKVLSADQLPESLANDVRVEFDYFIDEKPYKIPLACGHNRNPIFDFEHMFVQDPVTSRFLEYLKSKTLVFRVYGRDVQAEKIQAEMAERKALLFDSSSSRLNGKTATQPLDTAPWPGSPLSDSIGQNSGLNDTMRSIMTVAGGVGQMNPEATLGTDSSQSIEMLSSPQKMESPAPPTSAAPTAPTFAAPTNDFAEDTPKAPSLSQVRREQDKAVEVQEAKNDKKKTKTKTCAIQ